MAIMQREINADALARINWQERVSGKDWIENRWAITNELHELGTTSEDPDEAEVLKLLSCVISLHLSVNTNSPFQAALRNGDLQTAGLENFEAADVECLAIMAEQAGHPWLKARIADVAVTAAQELGMKHLWKLGADASEYYLEYASEPLHTDKAIYVYEEFQRGLQLGWVYGRKNADLSERYLRVLRTSLSYAIENRIVGVIIPFSDEIITRDRRQGAEVAAEIESAADQMADNNELRFDSQSLFYKLARRLWEKSGHSREGRRCHLAQGESLVRSAQGPGQAMIRSSWLAEGIAVLRRAGADRARVIELQNNLVDMRFDMLDEFQQIGHETDVTELVLEIERRIDADNLFDAIMQMLFDCTRWCNFEQLRESVIATARRFVLSNLFPSAHFDQDGTLVANQPAFDANDESSVYNAMVRRLLEFDHKLLGDVVVRKACDIIFNKFHPSLNDIFEILSMSPVVPEGHELSLARGFLAGFNFEWHEASTYLILQPEAIIRSEYLRRRMITKTSEDDGTEREMTLNELLSPDRANQVFGRSLVLELRTLLVEKTGHNLRNRWAHGLMTDDQAFHYGTYCLWWTLWRMILFPIYRARLEEARQGVQQATDPAI